MDQKKPTVTYIVEFRKRGPAFPGMSRHARANVFLRGGYSCGINSTSVADFLKAFDALPRAQ